jgi:hypothetical protein
VVFVFFSLVLFFFASALPGVRPEQVILLQVLVKSGLSVQCSLLKLLLLGSHFRVRAELADQRCPVLNSSGSSFPVVQILLVLH